MTTRCPDCGRRLSRGHADASKRASFRPCQAYGLVVVYDWTTRAEEVRRDHPA